MSWSRGIEIFADLKTMRKHCGARRLRLPGFRPSSHDCRDRAGIRTSNQTRHPARGHALLRVRANAICRSRSFHQGFRHGQSRQTSAFTGVDVVTRCSRMKTQLTKTFRLNGNPYRSLGVMGTAGKFSFGQSRDNSIFIPITTFDKYSRSPISGGFFSSIIRPQSRGLRQSAVERITESCVAGVAYRLGAPNNFGISRRTRYWISTIN